jgi:hypothetical protein
MEDIRVLMQGAAPNLANEPLQCGIVDLGRSIRAALAWRASRARPSRWRFAGSRAIIVCQSGDSSDFAGGITG